MGSRAQSLRANTIFQDIQINGSAAPLADRFTAAPYRPSEQLFLPEARLAVLAALVHNLNALLLLPSVLLRIGQKSCSNKFRGSHGVLDCGPRAGNPGQRYCDSPDRICICAIRLAAAHHERTLIAPTILNDA